MNWDLDINTLIQLFTLASVGGMGWQKISTLEKDILRLEEEVIAHRDLKSDLTIVKSRLMDLNEKIEKLVKGTA